MVRITRAQLGPRAAELVESLAQEPPSIGKLRAFKACLKPTLERWSSYRALEALPARLTREALWLLSGLNRRHLRLPWSFRRVNPTGGCIVAVLGPDFVGVMPRVVVQEGQRVRKGQLLFSDKRNPQVRFTAQIGRAHV